jgi:hypothetical protein
MATTNKAIGGNAWKLFADVERSYWQRMDYADGDTRAALNRARVEVLRIAHDVSVKQAKRSK